MRLSIIKLRLVFQLGRFLRCYYHERPEMAIYRFTYVKSGKILKIDNFFHED